MNQENESAPDLYLSNLKPLKFKRVLNLPANQENVKPPIQENVESAHVKSVECPSPQNV